MTLSKYMLCLFLMTISVFVSPSWGFEKKAHSEMSKVAVQLFGELYPEKAHQIEGLTPFFIEGSVKEDDIDITFQRLLNWHFYDPGSRLGRAWWGAYKSDSKRFADLVEKLSATRKEKLPEIYELAGRIAHHIQDMSSPPHAVPVYHLAKDPFDKYATHKIDGYTLTPSQLNSVKKDRRELDFSTLSILRKEAAEETIREIGDTIIFQGTVIGEDWSEYWRSYEQVGTECGEDPDKDFGCYGKNSFGTEKGHFTPEVYDWFYEVRVKRAIQDSLRLLVLLTK